MKLHAMVCYGLLMNGSVFAQPVPEKPAEAPLPVPIQVQIQVQNPAVPGRAVPQPLLPIPGNLQLGQIQIQAQAKNGAESTQTTIINGKRKIVHKSGDETIEIEDKNGKDITFKRTRTVNGEKKTEQFQAADPEALKKQNAEAGEIYQKHTSRQAAQIQINGVVQQGGFFGGTVTPAPGSGTRKIDATVRGRSIQLEDKFGKEIRLTITETIDGEKKTQTIEADSLPDLQSKSSAAFADYLRLTGLVPPATPEAKPATSAPKPAAPDAKKE